MSRPAFEYSRTVPTKAVEGLPERLRQEWQAHVISIVDVGVRVVELLEHMLDVPVPELLMQHGSAPDQVVLVVRPAIDVEEPQVLQSVRVAIDRGPGGRRVA